jgi:hypothetical protein
VSAVAITFGQSAWRIVTYDEAAYNPPQIPKAVRTSGPRLVWILFDEWDYGLTFQDRATGTALPELDRMVEESFHATNAYPPGRTTDESVPRLITGDMTTTNSNMAGRSSIFTTAEDLGLKTAVVGSHINYCGTYGNAIDACWTPNMDRERNSMGTSAGEMAVTELRYIFENQFRSPFGQPIGSRRAFLDYRFIARAARQVVASPAYGLVYVHFNVPHEPFFYNAATGEFNAGEKPVVSLFRKNFRRYFDALQLVNRTFGELRQAMEQSGVWNDTHVLLTTDHPYRARLRLDGRQDNRVPFIVRAAGTQRGAAYDGHFNTVLAPDLAAALLQGRLRSSEAVREWVVRAATAQPGMKTASLH